MKLYLPKGLDIDLHLKNNVPFKGFKKDKLLYILNCIVTIPNLNKSILLRDGFVPLSAKVLQDVMNDYKRYIDYGVQAGLLVCDNSYVEGFKCKGYKIALPHEPDVVSCVFKEVTLRRKFNQRYIKLQNTTKDYSYLNKWFNERLTVDVVAAKDFLEEEFLLKQKNVELMDYKMVYTTKLFNEDGTRGGYEQVYKDPSLQIQQGLLSIEKMEEQNFCCHVDKTVFRYHSVLTNMRSVLRNFLSYDGEKLVSIDIKNSQPYLICLLLQPSFWISSKIVRPNLEQPSKRVSKKAKFVNIDSFPSVIDCKARLSDSSIIDSQLNIDSISIVKEFDYFMLLEIKTMVRDMRFDTYIEQVTSGTLYDYLKAAFERILGYEMVDRKEVKTAVFQVLFTPNNFIGQKQARPKKLFKELFPEVYGLLNRIKKKDPTTLPRLLQQIESYVMLHVVAKRMRREHPNVPIFTVHDSIMTTISNQFIVEQIMQEELTRIVGYAPTLHCELLQPSEAENGMQRLRDKAKELSA
jgi:hypothetical protein